MPPEQLPPSRIAIILAFAAVYVCWGSTYLAIRYALETIPPFLSAAARFAVAGGVLYGWMRFKGVANPPPRQALNAAIVGALLLFIGNGGVVWAEQEVPSGLTALFVAIVPIFMVLLAWAAGAGPRPSRTTTVGLVTGLGGMVLLVRPWSPVAAVGPIKLANAAVLLGATLSWAAGSIFSRKVTLPRSALMSVSIQMLAASVLLFLAALSTGEVARFQLSQVSSVSVFGTLYLVVFGSLIGYSSYLWLLRVSVPAHVSTYAYVNPIVAIFLGWLIAQEPITPHTIVAAAVILVGVAIVLNPVRKRKARKTNS